MATRGENRTRKALKNFLKIIFLKTLSRHADFMNDCICTRVIAGTHSSGRTSCNIIATRKNGWTYLLNSHR